jgi:hypothetical protein
MADAWKSAPVVFEWYGDYTYLLSKGWSFDDAVKFMLDNHVTMINDNVGKVPLGALDKLKLLARLAGYRFVLRSGSYQLGSNRTLDVVMNWANTGVGKLYRSFELSLALSDGNGKVVAQSTVKNDPKSWLPGERKVSTKWQLPHNLASGSYTFSTALVDPTGNLPPLKLAVDAPTIDGWTQLGEVRVESM